MLDVENLGVPGFMLDVSRDGVIRFSALSRVHERLTGLRAAEMVGKTPAECLPPPVAELVEAQYRRCAESAELHEYEEELELPSGVFWWRTSLLPIFDESDGRVRAIFGLGIDITARKLAEQELRSAAYIDVLTGVANRRRFERDLGHAIAIATETGRSFSIILADVDRFKTVNDSHGHAAGDAVLREVASRLKGGIRAFDKVARIGGDEFVAILSASTESAVSAALGRIRKRMRNPFRAADIDLDVGVSFGAALWVPGMTALDLTKAADLKMYREKKRLSDAA
ncbi:MULTISPECIES: GGDEF domain-containing protein [unclassified Aureimonas]|uniref:sensor domain-containing diguanylate cyclase n=1 Tax=unclassified Aureimonas TaxID=2615206 RepID=UPI0006F9407B|nr:MULTISPECIES: GGDEF domain-containing protein [unclassified Aureimonas]KQT68898.1 hypothetical protein ASG54_04305 [Aureimonas sp. Leaf460]KQT69124.1 hypothetical protein ASG62_16910 [Aureimonas sp. Leaf427]